MPLVRISLKKGKPAAYREAIAEGVYQALRETFNVPEGDSFRHHLGARGWHFHL